MNAPTTPTPDDGIPTLSQPADGEVQDVAGARIDPEQALADARQALVGVRVVFDGLDPDELAAASARYFTASEDPRVVDLRDAVHVLGTLIRKHVPAGVQRNLAEEGLELVQMRANRGIFSPQLPE